MLSRRGRSSTVILPRLYSMMPAACSLPAASVTPSRRTPSMLAISSCVITRSFAGQPVQAQEEPATKLLVHRMMAVAHRGLGHLRDQRLREAQQQKLQRAARLELRFQRGGPDPVALAGALHHCAARRGFASHEERDAD